VTLNTFENLRDFYTVVGWEGKVWIGRAWKSWRIAVPILLASSLSASGEPSLPHSAFEEVSPLIEEVLVKQGEPFVEVFLRGLGHLNCYDVREFQVEKTERGTQIVPRLRRLNPSKPCMLGLKEFYDKAADLDPANPSTQNIEVLGYRGWVKKSYKPSS